VVAWTINEPEQMRRLIAAGVDGIITDYPDRLLSVLRDHSG
jgi:glycerophosphoryl diester phosphodiesterase